MMANASPLLDVRNLSVTVDTDEGEARILDHASLSLMPGSIHGVVGESGCGKSTLMRAILGILPKRGRATEGRILLGDRDLLNVPPAVLQNEIRGGQIGFIPQDPYQALNPVFRVGTQLLETTRSKAGAEGRAEANIISLLKSVQLPDPEGALDRYPHQFSGGQRQRLLIAAALASSPAIVLADEPTTALDVTTQLQILKLLRGLAEARGLSMLFGYWPRRYIPTRGCCSPVIPIAVLRSQASPERCPPPCARRRAAGFTRVARARVPNARTRCRRAPNMLIIRMFSVCFIARRPRHDRRAGIA